MSRSLQEVLKSTSHALFPAEIGEAPVSMDSVSCEGDTPLHALAWMGDTEGALLLIQHGANVNALGDMNETPLHVALTQRNRALVSALLAAGARTDIRSEFGETAKERARDLGMELERDA